MSEKIEAKFVHYCCMDCSDEGFFIADNVTYDVTDIYCPKCGRRLDWLDCSLVDGELLVKEKEGEK